MPSAAKHIDPLDKRDTFGHFEDFYYYNTAELFTSTLVGTTPTIADSDAHGGVLILSGSATDDLEAYAATTQAVVLPAANKPVSYRARAQYSEANTDDANVIFGFASTSATGLMQAAGAGPSASYSGAVIFKVDGGTVWQCESSNAGTQTTTATRITAGGSAYVDFEVNIDPISTTQAEVTFRINDEWCRDTNGDVIKHTLSLASLAAMKAVAGLRFGSANVETVNLDSMAWCGKR